MSLPEVIKQLLENGVHFGHLSKHWNPKMKKFIFGKKKDVYIIDLEKTAKKLEEAKEFAKNVAQSGGKILFVATKKQFRELLKEQAQDCGMPHIIDRWVGGFLTNFSTIRGRVKTYISILEKKEKGDFAKMPRKEVVRLNRQLSRMDRNYTGVKDLDELPACVFVVDPKKEIACVREANKLSIPIIALVDTDADPDVAEYPIPGNDDAIKSVKYITSCIAAAVKNGTKKAEEIIQAESEKARLAAEKSGGDASGKDEPDVSKYEDLDEKLKAEEEEKKEAKRRAQQKEV